MKLAEALLARDQIEAAAPEDRPALQLLLCRAVLEEAAKGPRASVFHVMKLAKIAIQALEISE